MPQWKSDSLIVLRVRESRTHGEAAKQRKTDFRETLPAHTEAVASYLQVVGERTFSTRS